VACEWNLGAYDPRSVPPEWGNRLLDRAAHRLAFRLDGRGFRRAARAAGSGRRRGRGQLGRALVLTLSALVVALGPAALIGGVYLMLDGPGATPYLGLVLALFVNRDVRRIGLVVADRRTLATMVDALGAALFRVLGPSPSR
jgi:hypothetical protein